MDFVRRGSWPTSFLVWLLPVAGLAVLGAMLLLRPPKVVTDSAPTADAKAYVSRLQLSDVKMNAAENLMQQQVVYVDGTIRNNGTRGVRKIDVYCLFSDVDGREIGRKRATVVSAASPMLAPSQSRNFELPFEGLPDGWNQAMPRLLIAQITFN